jgi:hypothetical protein
MRHVGYIAVALIAVACGPDPNARLPGSPAPSGNVTGTGGVVTKTGGTTGAQPGTGGTTVSPAGTGGTKPTATGGAAGSTSSNNGGTTGSGSGGSGGTTTAKGGNSGTGGTTKASTGALTTYTFGAGAEPCTPTKDISGGQIKDIGAGATCLRTADDFTGWNCSGMDDRTMKVNGTTVTCGGKPIPAKAGSFYYFDITAGTNAWAGFSWFCDVASCGPHSIPSCGHYPTWVSGGSAAPCSDATPTVDAGASDPAVDSGS